MNINTFEVIEAASTKWNFYKLTPGLVGGHCIGVDPYYLTYKSSQLKHHAQIITAGRSINDNMPKYVAEKIVHKILDLKKSIKDSRVLIMGATFKEDVSDIRNSKIFDVVKELESFNVIVDVIDPHASIEEVKHEYNYTIGHEPKGKYDAILVAVKHKEYDNLPQSYFNAISSKPLIFFDLKGAYYNKLEDVIYMSL